MDGQLSGQTDTWENGQTDTWTEGQADYKAGGLPDKTEKLNLMCELALLAYF